MASATTSRSIVPAWLVLIIANAIPIIGVVFFQWGVFPLVFLYWLENGVVCLVTVVKLVVGDFKRGRPNWPKKWAIPLFVIIFVACMALHGLIVLLIFASMGPDGKEGLAAIHHVLGQAVKAGVLLSGVGLMVSHVWSLAKEYWPVRREQRMTVCDAIMAPYGRIMVLHLFITGAAWLVVNVGESILVLLLFVALKTIVDLITHAVGHYISARSREANGDAADQGPPPRNADAPSC